MRFKNYLNESNKDYEIFIKKLSDSLYKTTKKLYNNQNVNHITFKDMFKKLSKEEGQELLDLAKKFEEFHLDNIKVYQRIINNKDRE